MTSTRPGALRFFAFVLAVLVLAVGLAPAAEAQYVMMPDSTNNRLVLFDPFDGSLVNGNFFGLAAGTPVHAMQVGNEIWVSEQLGDRISRWDMSGNSLGAITGAIDNVRGMELADGRVYLTSTGTNNGAPGDSVRMFDMTGADLGFFPTPASDGFGILEHRGDLLIASSVANDDVHRYSLSGMSLGTFHNSTALNFAEQMDHATTGDVLVAGFSSNNIVRLDAGTGAVLGTHPASGARGVYQLGNGNILWSSGAGASVFNVTTGGSTLIYPGGGRFFDDVVIPEPASGAMVLAGCIALTVLRRRRA